MPNSNVATWPSILEVIWRVGSGDRKFKSCNFSRVLASKFGGQLKGTPSWSEIRRVRLFWRFDLEIWRSFERYGVVNEKSKVATFLPFWPLNLEAVCKARSGDPKFESRNFSGVWTIKFGGHLKGTEWWWRVQDFAVWSSNLEAIWRVGGRGT